MPTEEVSKLTAAVDKILETILGKTAEWDSKVEESRISHEGFMTNADSRFMVQTGKQAVVRVDGDQNYWYPVRISNPDGGRFVFRRDVHLDRDTYGQWNGSLEFHFRAADSHYGSAVAFLDIERYQVAGKSGSRLLPDSDIPFIGRISLGHGPYDLVIWLRGNTTYIYYSENITKTPQVHYEEYQTVGTYQNLEPIPVIQGVDAGLPEVGYVKGA